MKFSTLLKSGLKRAMALGALVVSCGMMLSAQTFLHEGVVYRVSSGALQIRKATDTPENGTAPGVYTGEIVVPAEITYGGTTYKVTKMVASAFASSNITSLTLPDGMALNTKMCMDCALLETVVLPSDFAKTFSASAFQNCTSLKSVTIPANATFTMANAFAGCTSLKEVIFVESPTVIDINSSTFTDCPIEKLVLNRQIGDKYTTMTDKIFRNSKTLTTVEIGGQCTKLPASYFENASLLSSVTITSEFTEFGTNVFAGTALTEYTLPTGVTAVSDNLFLNCKQLKKVVLGDGVTTIGAQAFQNSAVEDVNLPAGLKSIGVLAFSGSALKGDVVLPAELTTVSNQAFAQTEITSIMLPATLKNLGDGVFMGCANLASVEVAEGNENFVSSADKRYIATADKTTLVAYAAAAPVEELADAFTTLAPYALYGATNLKKVNTSTIATFGDYSLYGSGVETLDVQGTIGRYVAAACPNLTTITLDGGKVPTGIVKDCTALTTFNFKRPVAVVGQDAFNGCTALASLDLGNILAILETDCFANSGVKNLTVGAYYPASMSEGVFTETMDITVTVPASLVEAYKAASGWSLLNIVGDANIAIGGESLGMPAGLYYGGEDGDLHCVYSDGNADDYKVGLEHMFQLVEFSNRIYGASAGKKFVYSGSAGTEGDGALFFISQVGGELFQATLLDNAGNNAYKDPFGLYIYGTDLYVNDRNVCVRKISADALALPQDYPSWMENNWMSLYNDNAWKYGCIKCGFAITQDQDAAGNPEPLYWIGMKYNGEGLYSFKEGNIGDASAKGPEAGTASYMQNVLPIFTTFNIDEKNGYVYLYIDKAGNTEQNQIKGGLYRIKLETLRDNPNPAPDDFVDALGLELVDGSPVKYEGTGTNEHVGISQLSIDANGEYMYWCYRAPSAEEAAANEAQDYAAQNTGKYWWADKYDETNPLHQSGIKRIKLTAELPQVEMVAPGVNGYGCVAVNYEGSTKPSTGIEGVEAGVDEDLVQYNGAEIVVSEDAVLYIYNAAGVAVDYVVLAAGEAYSVDGLAAGMYVVEAKSAAATHALKIVK